MCADILNPEARLLPDGPTAMQSCLTDRWLWNIDPQESPKRGEKCDQINDHNSCHTNGAQQCRGKNRREDPGEGNSQSEHATGTCILIIWEHGCHGCGISRVLKCSEETGENANNVDMPNLQVIRRVQDKDDQSANGCRRVAKHHHQLAIPAIYERTGKRSK